MTQAAFELQRTNAKVIDIALKYGYTSPTSFNRAFQSVHNIPPTAARNLGSTLNAYPAIRFSVQITGGNGRFFEIKRCFFRKKLANVPANVPNFCKRFKYFQAITENHFLVITGNHEV